jgi:16S rRNA processing protein RimM
LTDPDWVAVGRVGRPHGLDGSFFVEQASEDPRRLAKGAELYVGGELARVVSSKRGGGGRPVIRLDRTVPRGASLEVRREQLPPPDDGSYYVFQLVGLAVEEEGGRVLGSVRDVTPGVANDALELDTGIALPLVADCVREVDLERRRILVAPGFGDAG